MTGRCEEWGICFSPLDSVLRVYSSCKELKYETKLAFAVHSKFIQNIMQSAFTVLASQTIYGNIHHCQLSINKIIHNNNYQNLFSQLSWRACRTNRTHVAKLCPAKRAQEKRWWARVEYKNCMKNGQSWIHTWLNYSFQYTHSFDYAVK